MPGPSYNNPQLEYTRNKKNSETAAQRLKTEREKAKVAAENAKKAAQLRDQISQNNKTINGLSAIIKSAEITKAGYVTQYNTLTRNSLSPSSPGGATQTSGELAAIASYQTLITGREQLITTSKNNIKNLKNKNDAITKQINSIYNIKAVGNYNLSTGKVTTTSGSVGGGNGKGGGNNRKPEEEKPKGPYKYNFPLIKQARFSNSPTAPLTSSLGDASSLIDSPNARDAENYWFDNSSPGRGVLRVNKEWMKSILNNTTPIDSAGGNLDNGRGASATRPKDRQLYGFRFLYNPEKIQMVYDINADLHPGMIATGKDVFLPLTKSSSAVSLDLVLNRMEDMKYRSDPSLAIRNQVYFGAGETESILPEIKEIHEKGTMYDIEYLFKTMNAPHATFNSTYNGKTADMGFIRPTILELHLGNRLRYPVRVISLAIEHKIFDPRMVPIFSIVRIAFGRFIEFENKRETGGSGGVSGGRQQVR